MSGQSTGTFSLREVLAILACLVMVLSISFVIWSRVARRNMLRVADEGQLRGIHQSMLVFSREFDGIFPTPGLVDRKPDPVMGETPGRGPEDVDKNTTANLFSMCIMSNYFTPELCIGPTEPSPHVKFMSTNAYNWQSYTAAPNAYWDTNFKADLHGISNVSYAHMPIVGEAKLKQWRESLDGSWPILGNRGPLNGVADPNSITNRIHPPNDSWNGNICYNDGHVDFTNSFFRRTGNENLGYQLTQDNLFFWDSPNGYDAMITFTKGFVGGKPVIEHD